MLRRIRHCAVRDTPEYWLFLDHGKELFMVLVVPILYSRDEWYPQVNPHASKNTHMRVKWRAVGIFIKNKNDYDKRVVGYTLGYTI